MRGHGFVLLMMLLTGGWVVPGEAQTNATPRPMATPAPTPTPVASPSGSPVAVPPLVEGLSPGERRRILSALPPGYVDQATRDNPEPSARTVAELLSRLGPKAVLEPQAPANGPLKSDRPFRKEIVFGRFGYIRLGGINPDVLAKLDDALKEFLAHNITGLVLDLRTVPPGNDYGQAAEIAARFVPRNTEVFRLIQAGTQEAHAFVTGTEPLFTGPLALLVNADVAGAGEALAAVLKRSGHALLIGERTAGQTVQYERVPIGQNLILKVAVAEIKVPGLPDIFQNGLAPDLEVKLQPADQTSILSATDTDSILAFLVEEERPRTNEAALVAGKNPDLDAYEQQQANKGKPGKLKDAPLQRAFDFLTTLAFYHPNQ